MVVLNWPIEWLAKIGWEITFSSKNEWKKSKLSRADFSDLKNCWRHRPMAVKFNAVIGWLQFPKLRKYPHSLLNNQSDANIWLNFLATINRRDPKSRPCVVLEIFSIRKWCRVRRHIWSEATQTSKNPLNSRDFAFGRVTWDVRELWKSSNHPRNENRFFGANILWYI